MATNRILRLAGAALALALAFPAAAAAAEDGLARALGNVLATAAQDPAIDGLSSAAELRRFYDARGSAAAWRQGGAWSGQARQAAAILANAGDEGLDPRDYLVDGATLPDSGDDTAIARADARLSAAMLRYVGDVRAGRVVPTEINRENAVHPMRPDAAALLAEGLNAPDFGAWAAGLAPSDAMYRDLRAALPVYRKIAEGGPWPKLADGPTLHLGATGPEVAALRAQLSRLGDLTTNAASADELDEVLELAVRHFQRRNGLQPDGAVGAQTRAALNVTPQEHADAIALNLERLRWFARPQQGRYVIINVPGFELTAFADGKAAAKMPVIVGTSRRRTPMFHDSITAVTFMPTWTVPPKIAREEILPKIKRDPDYLAKQNMKVYSGWDAGSCEINPADVDWKSISARTLTHRFVQQPGATNALGRIRFKLNNEFGIFMHDTPAKILFGKEVRTYSHGCVRVGDAAALAAFVLQGDPAWPPEAIEAAANGGETKVVDLPRPVPVEMTYLTAWVDETGTVQFRPDVYGRDPALLQALSRPAAR